MSLNQYINIEKKRKTKDVVEGYGKDKKRMYIGLKVTLNDEEEIMCRTGRNGEG